MTFTSARELLRKSSKDDLNKLCNVIRTEYLINLQTQETSRTDNKTMSWREREEKWGRGAGGQVS